MKFVEFRKGLFRTSVRKVLPKLVWTFLMKGGLNDLPFSVLTFSERTYGRRASGLEKVI